LPVATIGQRGGYKNREESLLTLHAYILANRSTGSAARLPLASFTGWIRRRTTYRCAPTLACAPTLLDPYLRWRGRPEGKLSQPMGQRWGLSGVKEMVGKARSNHGIGTHLSSGWRAGLEGDVGGEVDAAVGGSARTADCVLACRKLQISPPRPQPQHHTTTMAHQNGEMQFYHDVAQFCNALPALLRLLHCYTVRRRLHVIETAWRSGTT